MAKLVLSPIEVPVSELHEQLSSVRLCEPRALDAMGQSLERHGQLTAIEVFVQDGELQLLDGFKRLQAARRMQWSSLRAVCHELSAVEAIVRVAELHAGRGLTELEEAWLVRALVREHGLTQGAVAERLGRHKSWVCRRMILAEGLEPQVQAWVRLGLVAARAAVVLAALPRGNHGPVGELVMHKGLTVRQTQVLVEQLLASDSAQSQELIARWSEHSPQPANPARPTVRKARSEAEWLSGDIITVHRAAARLQARLKGNALCAAPDAVQPLMTQSLRALVPVLHSLVKAITDSTCSPEAANLL